jgi:RNA polymerase sigma-70 factor (ECF subfamily)
MHRMDRASEIQAIRSAAEGDRAAAELLIRAHQGAVYTFILRMSGRPDVAEDIVQEAFVRVLTNLDRFDSRYRFSTWVFTIARRLYLNVCDKKKPHFCTDFVRNMRLPTHDPETVALGREAADGRRGVVAEALLRLPETQREIVILFHQQGWPIALIAQHMDLAEGTIKSHLYRGRRKLRALVSAMETPAAKEALA